MNKRVTGLKTLGKTATSSLIVCGERHNYSCSHEISLGGSLEEEIERYCPQCWRRLPPDVTYCPLCGIKAEIERPEPAEPRPLRIGRLLSFIAGFISLIDGIANFTAAAAVSLFIGSIPINVPHYVKRFYAVMVLMFFIMAILCIIGSACGWSAGMNPWRKEKLRSTVVEIAFLAFVGFLNLIESVMIWVYTEPGSLMFLAIGFLIIILSLPSLMLTALA